ncbi:MAG: coenzyme F420-0:L-glutamate ligase [Actinomycetota bacterium]|nr:coenzyme F420-0:L-glutamate ligase [Actinomycetota bacterium]
MAGAADDLVLSAAALPGLPEIRFGDDLTGLIARASSAPFAPGKLWPVAAGDVLVIAHKVVSKAEGRVRTLAEVTPSARAISLAAEHRVGKDPRHVQVVLEESSEILRAAHGVLICVTEHGFVCANAGVDASNAPGPETVILLPRDPDASARRLRTGLRALLGVAPAVLITDSFGRAWRHGQCDLAIGCAGLSPLEDWRGRRDASGRELRATWIAVADQLAGTADLARRKDAMEPVVVVRGAGAHVTPEDGPGAAALLRPEAQDLFR